MKNETRFDPLIRKCTESIFPACDWRLIKAQVAQESNFDPNAKSPAGAQGLLQLMPLTDKSLDGEIDGFDPEGNLIDGIGYLHIQYSRLLEISDHDERLKFALASYNCGRGYINKAIKMAYELEFSMPIPAGHKGARPGKWQIWEFSREMLKSPLCTVAGKRPDWKQVLDYVERIWERYNLYRSV